MAQSVKCLPFIRFIGVIVVYFFIAVLLRAHIVMQLEPAVSSFNFNVLAVMSLWIYFGLVVGLAFKVWLLYLNKDSIVVYSASVVKLSWLNSLIFPTTLTLFSPFPPPSSPPCYLFTNDVLELLTPVFSHCPSSSPLFTLPLYSSPSLSTSFILHLDP